MLIKQRFQQLKKHQPAAKTVLANEAATQAEVDAQVKAVQALNTAVTEAQSNGVAAKMMLKKQKKKLNLKQNKLQK